MPYLGTGPQGVNSIYNETTHKRHIVDDVPALSSICLLMAKGGQRRGQVTSGSYTTKSPPPSQLYFSDNGSSEPHLVHDGYRTRTNK